MALHGFLLDRYGGTPGLRDRGLLESAVAMPSMGLEISMFTRTSMKWQQRTFSFS